MDKNSKAFLIDFGILIVYAILIYCFLYFGYGHIYTKRFVSAIIILVNIPICWGTIILSAMGKNTIGHRIVNKKDNK